MYTQYTCVVTAVSVLVVMPFPPSSSCLSSASADTRRSVYLSITGRGSAGPAPG